MTALNGDLHSVYFLQRVDPFLRRRHPFVRKISFFLIWIPKIRNIEKAAKYAGNNKAFVNLIQKYLREKLGILDIGLFVFNDPLPGAAVIALTHVAACGLV